MKPKIALGGLCVTFTALGYFLFHYKAVGDLERMSRAYRIIDRLVLSIKNGKRTVFSKSDEEFLAECTYLFESAWNELKCE